MDGLVIEATSNLTTPIFPNPAANMRGVLFSELSIALRFAFGIKTATTSA